MAENADAIGNALSIAEEALPFIGGLLPPPFNMVAVGLGALFKSISDGADPAEINAQAAAVESELIAAQATNGKHRADIDQSLANIAGRRGTIAQLLADAKREVAGA